MGQLFQICLDSCDFLQDTLLPSCPRLTVIIIKMKKCAFPAFSLLSKHGTAEGQMSLGINNRLLLTGLMGAYSH